MRQTQGPCKDCKDRWVRDGHRCHESCEKYISWRAEFDRQKNLVLQAKTSYEATATADHLACLRTGKAKAKRRPNGKGI